MNTESKRTLLYPNIILAFSFFYFSYIIEQETEDLIRRLCYGIFLLLDVLVLVYLNSKTYLFLQVQEKVSSLFGGLFQKQKTKEEKDEIKELVE